MPVKRVWVGGMGEYKIRPYVKPEAPTLGVGANLVFAHIVFVIYTN